MYFVSTQGKSINVHFLGHLYPRKDWFKKNIFLYIGVKSSELYMPCLAFFKTMYEANSWVMLLIPAINTFLHGFLSFCGRPAKKGESWVFVCT